MSLSPDVRLGPYEVIGPLGSGGMGEVYNELMAAEIQALPNANGATLKAGVPRSLFPANAVPLFVGGRNSCDVTAEGQRFLIISNPAAVSVSAFTVVLNWTSGLKK
jgi:hypothetical protein